MIRQLKANLSKDFKSLFRSWTSIFLVVIGPVLIMILLMSAFSDIGFNSITIGHVTSYNSVDIAKYTVFLQKIRYVGNFKEYSTVEKCKKDLARQKVHLCLDPTPSKLNIHFDNTRELISLILLNQVRVAESAEKDSLVRENTENFIDEVQEMGSFMRQSSDFASTLRTDILNQKSELQETKKDLRDASLKIDSRLSQIRSARSSIISSRNLLENNVEYEIERTIRDLENVEKILDAAYQNAINNQDYVSASQIYKTISQIRQAKSSLKYSQGSINSNVAKIDKVIEEIDQVVEELEQSKNFLQQSVSKIEYAIKLIDTRVIELNNLQNKINEEERKISKLGRQNVDDIVKPLDLNFKPLFIGSDKLQQSSYDINLNDDQKNRLLNFGTIQTFIPLVISLLISFIATILSNILLLNEIHSPAFIRNQISPVSWFIRFCSLFVTILTITFAQVMVVLAISSWVFSLSLLSITFSISLILFFLIGTYTMIGMLIGYLVKTKTTSLLVSSFFLIMSLILGGIFYPVERMAPFIAPIANAIPFSAGISIMQQSIFYSIPINEMGSQLITLISIFVMVFISLLIARKLFIYRYGRGN